MKRGSVVRPGLAASGGAGEEMRLKVAVIRADGVFLGRVPPDLAERLVLTGAAARVGSTLHLRVPLPVAASRIEDFLKLHGIRGLRAVDHRRIRFEPAPKLPPGLGSRHTPFVKWRLDQPSVDKSLCQTI